eukprot:364087-Chlamydomonas_euryale.AAC.4
MISTGSLRRNSKAFSQARWLAAVAGCESFYVIMVAGWRLDGASSSQGSYGHAALDLPSA